jgi:hypothetical protein
MALLPATTTNSGTAISSTNKAFDQATNLSAIPYTAAPSGGWLQGQHNTTNVATAHGHAAELCMPVRFPTRLTFDRISAYVATAGSTGAVLRFGLRADVSGLPGTLIADYGTVATTTSANYPTVTVSVTFDPFTTYWLSFTPQNAAQDATPPTTRALMRCCNPSFLQAYTPTPTTQTNYGWRTVSAIGTTGTTTGALPTSFTPAASGSTVILGESMAFWLRCA